MLVAELTDPFLLSLFHDRDNKSAARQNVANGHRSHAE